MCGIDTVDSAVARFEVDGWSLLHVAAGILANAEDTVSEPWWSFFRALLKHGADLHFLNTDDKTPLLCRVWALPSEKLKPILVK
jgi:hypothetical protein